MRWSRLALGVAAVLGGLGLAFAFAPLHMLVRHEPRSTDALFKRFPVLVAHRGWSAVAPENTLSAFAKAAELGVPFELDVGLCQTGEAVVIHDDTLVRTTDGSGRVAQTPLSTLEQLDAGSWFSPAFAGERVPTLREVLERFSREVLIDIELKTTPDKDALAQAVVTDIERAGATERVFVTSFDPYLLAAVRKRNPSIVRGQLLGSFRGSDLAWHEIKVLQNLLLNGQAQPDLLVVEDAWLTERWQTAMQARGYRVMVWTVNDPARIEALKQRGIDGIITDKPDIAL